MLRQAFRIHKGALSHYSGAALKNVRLSPIVSRSMSTSPFDPSKTSDSLSSSDIQNSLISPELVNDASGVLQLIDSAPAAISDVNFVVRNVMELFEGVHNFVGVPYWEAIVLTTIGLRIVLFPVALKGVQSAARMAAMRPDMAKIQEAMAKDTNTADMRVKARYEQEMRALFVKYNVNPFRSLIWPFVQLPVFISIFMALRDMGAYYPGYATGGAWWFNDLSAADPTYILPVFNSLSFLIMLEIGSDGVEMKDKKNFKWIMRGLGVAMVPLTMSMPQVLISINY
jgi:YidC/Oxa1 family membrane protein insertase